MTEINRTSVYPTDLSRLGRLREIQIWSYRDWWCCQSQNKLVANREKVSLLTFSERNHISLYEWLESCSFKRKDFKFCCLVEKRPQLPWWGFIFLSIQTPGEERARKDDNFNMCLAIKYYLKWGVMFLPDLLLLYTYELCLVWANAYQNSTFLPGMVFRDLFLCSCSKISASH